VIADYFNIDISLLINPTRQDSQYRTLAINIIRDLTRLSHSQISKYFITLQPSGISSSIRRGKKLISNDAQIREIYSLLIKKLSAPS
jgi:chromosomal replication initiation ATPase DnaA